MWFLTARSYDGLLLIRLSNIFFREHPNVLGEDILLLIEHLGVLLRTHSIIFCSDILVLWKIYWKPIGKTIWLFWGDFVVYFLLSLLVFYAEDLLVFFPMNLLLLWKDLLVFMARLIRGKLSGLQWEHFQFFYGNTSWSSIKFLMKKVLLVEYFLIFFVSGLLKRVLTLSSPIEISSIFYGRLYDVLWEIIRESISHP